LVGVLGRVVLHGVLCSRRAGFASGGSSPEGQVSGMACGLATWFFGKGRSLGVWGSRPLRVPFAAFVVLMVL
jgi:hypothetical protein